MQQERHLIIIIRNSFTRFKLGCALQVEKIVSHSLFNVANFEADIAIIKLSRPVEVSDYVRPACYPSTYGEHTELKHLSPGSVGTVDIKGTIVRLFN